MPQPTHSVEPPIRDRGTHLAPGRRRRPALVPGAVAALALVAGLGFAACNAGASTLPSISLPSVAIPSVTGSISVTGSGVTGCVDPATFAIVMQLESQAANAPTLLAQNKDALISGLQSFQPPDQATSTWRDQLVTALQSNDMTTAAAKIQMVASGEVNLSSC